jgi:hypothetical protein
VVPLKFTASPAAQASLVARPEAQASPAPSLVASPAASLAPSPAASPVVEASPAASGKQMTFEQNINRIKALAENIESIMSSQNKEELQKLLETYRSDFGKKQITGVIDSIIDTIDDKTIKARINRYKDQYEKTINLTSPITYIRANLHLERIKTQFVYITNNGNLFLEDAAKKTRRGNSRTSWGGARKTRCRTRKTRR